MGNQQEQHLQLYGQSVGFSGNSTDVMYQIYGSGSTSPIFRYSRFGWWIISPNIILVIRMYL